MLNPFPDFLWYGSFLTPTLLRFAAACIFFYLAYVHLKGRGALGLISFPVVGSGVWIVWVSLVVEFCIGLALLLGYATQYAAALALIAALKHLVWRNAYPQFFILPRTTAFLLMVLLACLLLSGAGAFAFDIPL